MRVRLLPPSSDGFIRMARVAAVVTFLGVVIYLVRDTQQFQHRLVEHYAQRYVEQRDRCTIENYAGCEKQADDEFHDDANRVVHPGWNLEILGWIFYTSRGLFWGSLVLLGVRTIGYVALGFSRPSASVITRPD